MNNDELLIVIKDMFEKKTDEIKGMFEKKTDEIKQYVDDKIKGQSILIEKLQSTIETIAEGHSNLNNKIDRVETKVDSIEKRFDSVEKDIRSLKAEVAVAKDYVIAVDAKLNEHEIVLRKVK